MTIFAITQGTTSSRAIQFDGALRVLSQARTRKARLWDNLIWATCSFVRSPPRRAKSSLQSN